MLISSRSLCATAAILAALGCAACGSEHPSTAETAAAAGGSPPVVAVSSTGSGASGATGGGGQSPCTEPRPANVPEDWVRPPGAPCNCDIYIAPDGASANAPSEWASCGDGCEELVFDWEPTGNSRMYFDYGFSDGNGNRYLGCCSVPSDR